MNISAPFIARPIATTLLMVALLAAGAVGYNLLPVAALPNVDIPTLSVTASLPGADPETMASSVAQPLERQFADLPGVNQITSSTFSAIPRSRCNSIYPAASTARRPMSRARSMQRKAVCPKISRTRRPTAKPILRIIPF